MLSKNIKGYKSIWFTEESRIKDNGNSWLCLEAIQIKELKKEKGINLLDSDKELGLCKKKKSQEKEKGAQSVTAPQKRDENI